MKRFFLLFRLFTVVTGLSLVLVARSGGGLGAGLPEGSTLKVQPEGTAPGDMTVPIRSEAELSKAVKDMLEISRVGTVHSAAYLNRIADDKDIAKYQADLQSAQHLLTRLNVMVAYLRANWDTLSKEGNEELLTDLVALQENVTAAQPLGAGNVLLADTMSLISTALLFRALGNDAIPLQRLEVLANNKRLEKTYSAEALSAILRKEVGYLPKGEPETAHRVLSEAVLQARADAATTAQETAELASDDFYRLLMRRHADVLKWADRAGQLQETDALVFAWDVSFSIQWDAMSRIGLKLSKLPRIPRGEKGHITQYFRLFQEDCSEWERHCLLSGRAGDTNRLRMADVIRRVNLEIKNKGFATIDAVFLEREDEKQ